MILKILAALKIGWIIGQSAGWLLFGCLMVSASLSVAGEPFRVEPRPLAVPLPEPTPEQKKGLAEPPEAAQQDATPAVPQEAGRDAAGTRPVVYLYTSPGCAAGDQMRAAANRGEFVGIDVQERPPPDWYTLCPTFHWSTPDGRSWKYPADANSYRGVGGMLKAFDISTDGARLRLAASRGASVPLTSSSPFDQIQKFTGAGGRFTFVPDQPINASLDDRTSLKFQSIQGRYAVSNGVVTLKLEQPLPVGQYQKWIRWGFQITGGSGPENVTASTADVTIETNRGPQKVTIQMEPQK